MEINQNNYKEVLLQWLEGELSPTEVLQAEAYILVNESAAKELRLLRRTKLQPEENVFFPNKNLLMRDEKDAAPAVIRNLNGGNNYRKFAFPLSIAASLLLFFILFNNKYLIFEKDNFVLANVENSEKKNLVKVENSGPQIVTDYEEKVNIKDGDETKIKIEKISTKNRFASNKKSGISIRNNDIKAFSEDAQYGKNEKSVQIAEYPIALVKVDVTVIPVALDKENISLPELTLALKNPENEIAENSNPKTGFEMEPGFITKAKTYLSKTIQIKKRSEDNVNYYALRVETNNIKIVKTFKSNF